MGFLHIWLIIKRIFSDSEGDNASIFVGKSSADEFSGCEFQVSTNIGSRYGETVI